MDIEEKDDDDLVIMGNESDELELVEVKKPDIEDKVEKKIKPN